MKKNFKSPLSKKIIVALFLLLLTNSGYAGFPDDLELGASYNTVIKQWHSAKPEQQELIKKTFFPDAVDILDKTKGVFPAPWSRDTINKKMTQWIFGGAKLLDITEKTDWVCGIYKDTLKPVFVSSVIKVMAKSTSDVTEASSRSAHLSTYAQDWDDLVAKTGLADRYRGLDKAEKAKCRLLAQNQYREEHGYPLMIDYRWGDGPRAFTASSQWDQNEAQRITEKWSTFCKSAGLRVPQYKMVQGQMGTDYNSPMGRIYVGEDEGDYKEIAAIWKGYSEGLTIEDLSQHERELAANPKVLESMVASVRKAVRKATFE